jgi:hypothetical protein
MKKTQLIPLFFLAISSSFAAECFEVAAVPGTAGPSMKGTSVQLLEGKKPTLNITFDLVQSLDFFSDRPEGSTRFSELATTIKSAKEREYSQLQKFNMEFGPFTGNTIITYAFSKKEIAPVGFTQTPTGKFRSFGSESEIMKTTYTYPKNRTIQDEAALEGELVLKKDSRGAIISQTLNLSRISGRLGKTAAANLSLPLNRVNCVQ